MSSVILSRHNSKTLQTLALINNFLTTIRCFFSLKTWD